MLLVKPDSKSRIAQTSMSPHVVQNTTMSTLKVRWRGPWRGSHRATSQHLRCICARECQQLEASPRGLSETFDFAEGVA
jgi:hypothetical protein